MATEIIMPVLGMTMESGIIVEWMKEEGDSVAEGEVLFNVETDKSVMEVEAKASGTLLKILHGPGDDVPIQQVIGYIGEAGEAIAEAVDTSAPGDGDAATNGTTAGTAATPTDGAADGTTGGQDDAAAAGAATPGPSGRVKISPKARRYARDLGIAIEHIAGTGPGGRIVFSDVAAFAARTA
ncbi:MAG: iron ABC transporter ATP-binding protein, partial [Gemmatimonadetes bacterium]|nr:iron ABC transporter ATP-binding protein [Gemmatimonadota bacterium]